LFGGFEKRLMSKNEYLCLAKAVEKAISSRQTDVIALWRLLLMCANALRTAAAEKPNDQTVATCATGDPHSKVFIGEKELIRVAREGIEDYKNKVSKASDTNSTGL